MSELKTKHCKHCDRDLPLSMFSKDKNKKDGLAFYCKDCVSGYGKQRRRTPQGIYEQLKGRTTYALRHPQSRNNHRFKRAGQKELLCTKEDFVKWYENQPKICYYCGIPGDKLKHQNDVYNNGLTRLGIDAIDNKRGYSIDNMVLSCARCNAIKSNFFTHNEMLEIGKIVKEHWENE